METQTEMKLDTAAEPCCKDEAIAKADCTEKASADCTAEATECAKPAETLTEAEPCEPDAA